MPGITLSYTIPDIDLWASRFMQAPAKATAVLNIALAKSAVLVEGAARGNAPVKTGTLRNSIHSTPMPLKAIIYTRTKYAAFVEKGTGVYGENHREIKASDYGKKVFATRQNPGWGTRNDAGYFIIGTKFKGQKANPFMERAYTESREEIVKFFDQAGKDFLRSLKGI